MLKRAEHLSKTHDLRSLKFSLIYEVKALSLKSTCDYSTPFLFSHLESAIFFRALFFFGVKFAFSVLKLVPYPKALHYLAVHLSSKDTLNQATFPTSASLQSNKVSPREKCQILHPLPPLNNDHFG